MRAYIDSDIVIWHLRDDSKATALLHKLSVDPEAELWMGVMQRGEILFYMKPGEEPHTLKALSRFKTHPLTQAIMDRGARLYHQWNPSHGTDQNDAILAATVEATGGRLYTLNTKHFPMPHIT